jgi:anthranilate phosphoribosyltransferase
MLTPILEAAEAGQNLSFDQMAETIGVIMDGDASEDQVARLLISLHNKGETADEIAGAAMAMRAHMTPIRSSRNDLLDVVGTGGDGASTFNISTVTAIVTAAAGVPVAKHGSIAATSRTGAADVLEIMGVNIRAEVPVVEACLEELGLCFCFAPLLHEALKHVAPIRKKLGTPTIFNILGPLANPAGAQKQLLGVAKPEWVPLMSEVLQKLGTERAVIVHGSDGIDEVTLGGPTTAVEIDGEDTRQFEWNPEDFGFNSVGLDLFRVENADDSARIIRDILSGKPGPAAEIVIANTAAALWTANADWSIAQCTGMATEAIASGAAEEKLAKLVERTNAE